MLPWTRLSIDQSSLQGCTGVILHARIPGSRTPYAGMSDQGCPIRRGPSFELNREATAGLILSTKELWALVLRTPYGTWLAGEADPPPTTGVRRSKPGAGRGKAGV